MASEKTALLEGGFEGIRQVMGKLSYKAHRVGQQYL
jgi:hypothetical protein